jgi:hypothetical protein
MPEEQFKAPDKDAPKTAQFVGMATPYQQALSTLIDTANDEHAQVHDTIDLPGGAHAGLPREHRQLHIIINIGKQLLFEDLTNTFKKIGAQPHVGIDREWNVYYVPQKRKAKREPKELVTFRTRHKAQLDEVAAKEGISISELVTKAIILLLEKDPPN